MLEVREVRENDDLSSFKEAIYGNGFFPVRLVDEPYEKDIHAVAVKDGKVVAFGCIRGFDEDWPDKTVGVCVHPEHRQKGYARAIMTFLEVVAREKGLKRLRLHVNDGNVPARLLYHKLGYVFAGRREDGEAIYYKEL